MGINIININKGEQMKYINNIKFSTEKYINIRSFDFLVKAFNIDTISEYEDITKRYLVATIAACIEGIIQLDIDNNYWEIWVGEYIIKYKLENFNRKEYMFLSLYKFIKCNNGLYEYIKGYYNLWHQNNGKTDFSYDIYHLKDLKYNFYNLYNLLMEDKNKANEFNDDYVNEICDCTYKVVKDLFC